MTALLEALDDTDSYVKKTAILGCVKVHQINPDIIKND
jgi:hypothetical protein